MTARSRKLATDHLTLKEAIERRFSITLTDKRAGLPAVSPFLADEIR